MKETFPTLWEKTPPAKRSRLVASKETSVPEEKFPDSDWTSLLGSTLVTSSHASTHSVPNRTLENKVTI